MNNSWQDNGHWLRVASCKLSVICSNCIAMANNNNNRNAQMLPQGLLHRVCVFPMPFTNNGNPYNFPETRTMANNFNIQPSI
ncbi:hypothetical protein ACLKA6_018096 [Drosophila palustris]